MKYRNRKRATEYLRENGIPCGNYRLAQLAMTGEGPQFRYWGRQTIYTEKDLDAWIEARLGSPVSSTKAAPPSDKGHNGELIDEPSESLLSPPPRTTRHRRRPRKQSVLQSLSEREECA